MLTIALPFAVPSEERSEVLTSSMEVAAVLLLAESKRWKLGFSEAAKKTAFASKVYYPLWAVPWENGSLIIDSLNVFSGALTWQVLPDITSFIDDVERGASDREEFWAALEKHKKTFIDFAENVEVKIDALVSDRELLSAVLEYLREAAPMQSEENLSSVLMPPKLDMQTAVERANQVSHLHKQIQTDISGLEYVEGFLTEILDLHERMILKEIESLREVYNEEISKLQPVVDGKVEQLERKREAEIAKMKKFVEKELKSKEGERERSERELQRLELEKADFIRRRDMQKRKNDKIGLARWEHRIKVCESRIREVKRKLGALREFIEETRRQNEVEIGKLRSSYQELIEKERSKVAKIEAQREENIMSKQREIETLKHITAKILNNIKELANRERDREEKLKELAIPWQIDEASLICLPFYLIGYQTEGEIQLQPFPPVRVKRPKGVMKAFKKALMGLAPASKIKLFLQPRSKALERMLDFAFKRAESDEALSETLRRTAASSNLLARYDFKETLIKGLEELKAKGWIGQKEVDAMAKAYGG